jgi:hypothetical protein
MFWAISLARRAHFFCRAVNRFAEKRFLSYFSSFHQNRSSNPQSDMERHIRWKQRFQNFTQALEHLKYAVMEVRNPSDLEKQSTIQRFEFTHELA